MLHLRDLYGKDNPKGIMEITSCSKRQAKKYLRKFRRLQRALSLYATSLERGWPVYVTELLYHRYSWIYDRFESWATKNRIFDVYAICTDE